MNFSLYYRKNKNEELFRRLEKSTLGLEKLQNYVPLYEKFFSLNTSNFNSINLNQKYSTLRNKLKLASANIFFLRNRSNLIHKFSIILNLEIEN